MEFDELINQMSKNINKTIEYDYEDMLFKTVIRAYSNFTDISVEYYPPNTDERKLICTNIWKWYADRYHSKKSKDVGTVTKSKSGRSVGNISVLRESVANGEIDKFLKKYSFNNFDRETFLTYLKQPTQRPNIIYLLRVAVGFKLSEKECNALLYQYGYMKLHAKNPFHIAIYVILKDIEKQSALERKTQFDQFENLQNIFLDALKLWVSSKSINEDIILSDNEIDHSSTTVIYKDVLPRLTANNYAKYMAKHKTSFNEHHRKLLNEYYRIERILLPLFYDANRNDSTKMWAEYDNAVYTGTILNTSNYTRYSLFEFVNRFCDISPTVNHFKRDMHDIFSDKRIHTPTREIMIIMWLFECCYTNTSPLPCSKDLALLYVKEYLKLICNSTIKSLSVSNLSKVLKNNPTESVVVNSQQDALNILGIYQDKYNDSKMYLDISRMLGFDTSKFSVKDDLLYFNHWRGAEVRSYIDDKLSYIGMLPLTTNNLFDRTILELCKVNCKFDTSGERSVYCYENERITDIIPGEVSYFRNGDKSQSQPIDFLPEKLKFMFMMIRGVNKKIDNPLTCKIYEIF